MGHYCHSRVFVKLEFSIGCLRFLRMTLNADFNWSQSLAPGVQAPEEETINWSSWSEVVRNFARWNASRRRHHRRGFTVRETWGCVYYDRHELSLSLA